MQLKDYLRVLRQRGWIIVLLAVLTAVATYGYSRIQTPVYKSTIRMLVKSRPDFGQTQAAQDLIRDYAQFLDSSLQAAEVINELELDMTPQNLLDDVTIAPATSESIIAIEVKSTDPDLANAVASEWGNLLVEWRTEENANFRREEWITVERIDDPLAVLHSPKTKTNTAAGAVFGALLGIIAVFLLEWAESGIIRRSEEIEHHLNIAVIGTIPDRRQRR